MSLSRGSTVIISAGSGEALLSVALCNTILE